MPIPISNYVAITSGIGGGAVVGQRNLGALIITGNTLCPTGTILTFTSAAAVGTYFGTSSEEYKRAVFYFGWVSKSISSPTQISFWFWNNDVATGSLIFGAPGPYTLATFTAISSGEIALTLGGVTHTLTGINLSGAGSLATVASDLQTAIQAYSAGGSAWTGATVTYNPAGNGSFNLVSGSTGTDVVSVAVAAANDLGGPLGWLSTGGAIYSNGTAAQLITANLNQLINLSNNFGSFCFTFGLAPVLATITSAANWNNSLTPNIQFMFSINVTAANASSWQAALYAIGGITATLSSPGSAATTEYPEMCPMMILAATQYTNANSTQNYMFQQFNLTPSVSDPTNQANYDNLLINYYGQTQTAGQLINFYQRGVMWGLAVNPSDQNIYANEIWFKDACGVALMNLLLAFNEVPANRTGLSQVLSTLQTVIQQALSNGSISVGKTLTTLQQLYITEQSGNATAWQQVQNAGYWVSAAVQAYTVGSSTQYKIVYTIIYSKEDDVRLIQGTDILI